MLSYGAGYLRQCCVRHLLALDTIFLDVEVLLLHTLAYAVGVGLRANGGRRSCSKSLRRGASGACCARSM